MKTLPRVFFDSNFGTLENGYPLLTELSRIDLNKIQAELRNEVRVLLYMPDDLEVEANLVYDEKLACWVAFADLSTLRDL